MSNYLTLSPIYSVWRAGKKLCLGVPNTHAFLEIDYCEDNKNLISNLLNAGISRGEGELNKVYRELLDRGMLVDSSLEKKRNQQFYEWLGVSLELLDLHAPIMIFGAGAGGSTITYLLAQFGFSNLIVYDSDVVEISEIEKTLIFRKSHLGMNKVCALQEIIQQNFDISIIAESKMVCERNEIQSAINKYAPAFIVKACDPNLSFRLHLNEHCFKNNIPFIYMAYSYNYIVLGPLFKPGVTCCDNSNNLAYIRKKGEDHNFYLHEKLFTSFTKHPSISVYINTLGSLILNEIILFLSNHETMCRMMGKQLYFDLVNLKIEANPLYCYEECQFSCEKTRSRN